jgi:hypothetical protein
MKYAPIETVDLPSSSQLATFRGLHKRLQDNPENVTVPERIAYRNLILGMSPDAMSVDEINLVEKLWPQEWRQYCEWEWGTPEEQLTNNSQEVER